MTPSEWIARGLGLFTVGLGLVQVAAPRRFARAVGAPESSETVARLIGVRELAAAPGLLIRPRPVAWTWMRVGGDLMDLALLAILLRTHTKDRERSIAATGAVIGITALDALTAIALARGAGEEAGGDEAAAETRRRQPAVQASITIAGEPDEIYRLWHDLENLPRFMENVESVERLADGTSHWKVRGPLGTTVEWDAETTDERPGELIAWRSVEGASVHHAGSVRFRRASGDRGTEVHVEFDYSPPGGPIGKGIAKVFGSDPLQQTESDLRRLKQIVETGDVVKGGATPADGPLHPAQPA